MKTLTEIFPHASQSVQAANPQLSCSVVAKTKAVAATARRRGVMNRTEAEFSLILEEQKRRGEILRWEFEPITLRFAGVKYTPDFIVIAKNPEIKLPKGTTFGRDRIMRLIEVKGGFTGGKFERAVERFRHARTYWPEFAFELHKKTKNGWLQIH